MKKRNTLLLAILILALVCSLFSINALAAVTDKNPTIADRFLTDKHTTIGCNVNYANDKMVLDVNYISAQIETVGLDFSKFNGANSLKIVFDAEGKCSGVRLFALTTDNEYIEEAYSSTKNTKESPVVCYLPINHTDIKELRIVFEDLETAKIEIQSITPYSISLSDTSHIGQIDTCAINVSSNEVLCIGKVNNSELDAYSGKELHLFEQPLNEQTTPETLSQLKSTLKTTVGANEFIFRIKCNKKEELRAYLYKKYTVAVKLDDTYVLIDSPKCITNPDALSNQTTTLSQTSGKGQFGGSLAFMQENMITDTTFAVDIGKFFNTRGSSGAKYESLGNVFYYDPEYVEQIDSVLLPYSEKKIQVTLLITLTDTQNDSLNKILVHPDSSIESEYLAFNTTSKSSLSYLRAFCEFLAQRYCVDYPCVSRAVFGNEVANASVSYNMGEKKLSDFTESYAVAFLTANNAFRSYAKGVNIYTNIDNNWDEGFSIDYYDRFDNKAFLTSFNNCISNYGNINWGVLINVYPKQKNNYLAYADKTISHTSDSESLTFANLEILSEFLKAKDMLYNNAPRSLVIVENALFNELDEQTVAASYAYNYYKSKGISADAYITNLSFEFGSVMKYIDTSLTYKTTEFALNVLNANTWGDLIENFTINMAIYKNHTHAEFIKSPETIMGKINLGTFSADTDNWYGYGVGEEISAGKEMSGKAELLSVKLGQILSGESKGIIKQFSTPLNLTLIPIVHFDVNIASLPPNTDRAILTIKFTSGNETIEFSGAIDKTIWNEIYCDLSSFQGISNIGEISITVSSENGEMLDDPQIFITSIEGISLEYDTEYLKKHFMTEKSEGLFQKIVDKYAIPFFVVVICISTLILSYRHNRSKEE